MTAKQFPRSNMVGDVVVTRGAAVIRTRISLMESEYTAAKAEARRLGISLSELLRRSLRTVIPGDESSPWMRHAGMVESGAPDSSRKIDDVIYGGKP